MNPAIFHVECSCLFILSLVSVLRHSDDKLAVLPLRGGVRRDYTGVKEVNF